MTMPLPTPHLEARSDDEALETASARVGYNFYDVEKLAWKFTPCFAASIASPPWPI